EWGWVGRSGLWVGRWPPSPRRDGSHTAAWLTYPGDVWRRSSLAWSDRRAAWAVIEAGRLYTPPALTATVERRINTAISWIGQTFSAIHGMASSIQTDADDRMSAATSDLPPFCKTPRSKLVKRPTTSGSAVLPIAIYEPRNRRTAAHWFRGSAVQPNGDVETKRPTSSMSRHCSQPHLASYSFGWLLRWQNTTNVTRVAMPNAAMKAAIGTAVVAPPMPTSGAGTAPMLNCKTPPNAAAAPAVRLLA